MNKDEELPTFEDMVEEHKARSIEIIERIKLNHSDVLLLTSLYKEIRNQDIPEKYKVGKLQYVRDSYFHRGIKGLEDIKNKVGEWHDEPDELQFTDEETGLECLIMRNPYLGSFCGYVFISMDHPYKGFGMLALDDIDVHGGVTWSDKISGYEDKGWGIGFDCAHAGDLLPYNVYSFKVRNSIFFTEKYRNIEYVKKECKKLAKQLFRIANRKKGKI